VTSRNVLVGLGNPLRRDDGVGPAVAAALAHRVPPGVEVVVLDGDDPAALLDTWRGARYVVVIEAVRHPDTPPGAVHHLDPDRLGCGAPAASSHGVDLVTAYRLSAVLRCRPERLVVLGVQVADTGLGRGLSPDLAAALPRVVDRVVAELRDAGPGHGRGPQPRAASVGSAGLLARLVPPSSDGQSTRGRTYR
jgi:hydrogenase maturation protease